MAETIENKENKFFIMDTYYGNFAINKLFERLVTGFSDYREKSEITGDVTGLQFKSAYADLFIDARMIYSLLVYSFFVEYNVQYDEMAYTTKLFDVVGETEQNRKKSFEIFSGIKWANPEELKVRKKIVEMFPESLGIYTQLLRKTSAIERQEIIQKIVERFNKYSKELNIFIKLQENIEIENKVDKLFKKINEIFFDDINVELGYNLNELDVKSYIFLMLKDAVTLILLQLLFENTTTINKKVITFDTEKYHIYMLMVILSEFKENGNNLLRLNKKADFLKYGATLDDTIMLIKKFFGLQKIGRGAESIEGFEDFPHKLFYFLLGYGASFKEKYSLPERRNEGAKLEFFMSDVHTETEDEKPFAVTVSGTNFRIERMTEMLALSEVSSESVRNFRLMFQSTLQEFGDSYNIDPEDLENALRETLMSADEEVTEDWLSLRQAAEKLTLEAKKNLLKEFVASLVDKNDTFSSNIGQKAEGFKELIISLSIHSEIEIQKNRIETIGPRILLTNNFFASERLEAEKDLEILKGIEKYEKDVHNQRFNKYIYPNDIDFSDEEYKEILLKRIEKISKKKILINAGFDFDSGDFPLERYNVYQRIFYLISVYEKIWKNNTSDSGNFIKSFNNIEFEEIFHSLVTDISILISCKNENEFIARNSIIETDYLNKLCEKVEKYFSFYLLTEEKIEELEDKEKEEGKKMLLLFQKALECGYYFFINPWQEIIKKQQPMLQRRRTDDETEEDKLSADDYFDEVVERLDPEILFG